MSLLEQRNAVFLSTACNFAANSCIQLYLVCKQIDAKTSLRKYVNLYNKLTLKRAPGVELKFDSVYRTLKRGNRRAQPAKPSTSSMHYKQPVHNMPLHLLRYIYFQKMLNGLNHSLRQHINSDKKQRFHLPCCDLSFILAELAIVLQRRFAYYMDDLHVVPHRNKLVGNKAMIGEVLCRHGITHATLPPAGNSGCYDLRSSWGFLFCQKIIT